LRVQQSGVKEEERPVKVWNAAGAEIAPATKGTPFFGRRLALPERPEERQVPASATRFPAWPPSRHFAPAWLDFARMEKHLISRQE
jgi:hypothetical protein